MNSTFLKLSSALIFVISFVLAIFAAYFQPLIGDDYSYKYSVENSKNFFDYFIFNYTGWSGRSTQILLSYLAFKYNFILDLIKIINIPVFFFCLFIVWKIITGEKKISSNFLIFSLLIWLSISSVAENIIWFTGSITYLYPLFISLFFLNFYFDELIKRSNSNLFYHTFRYTLIIISGLISGSSNEQIAFVTLFVSVYVVIKIYIKQKKIYIHLVTGIFFVLIGIIYLIYAPGSYERLNTQENNLVSNLYKYTIYIFSSYFSLGEETSGKLFFLSIIAISFLFNSTFYFNKNIIYKNLFWLVASLLSLLIMFPVVSFVSVRTTFYALIFFYIFWLSINYQININNSLRKTILILILSSLFFVDSIKGSLINYSFLKESNYRINLINTAILNDLEKVEVPFFTIIPSRITYIQNPLHDKELLNTISFYNKIKISHNVEIKNEGLPFSKNILKNVKFFLD
tara:strand:- start:1372 stop:2745 length:1374 start_codon:yes stop_codon:yes gene_type:complete